MYPSLMTKKTIQGMHCLHLAACHVSLSCYQAIESLVFNGISVEKREQHMKTLIDRNEITVLHCACSEGRKELCMYLSNTYPSLMTQKDADNTHCLHYAAESGNSDCYKAMESLVLKLILEEKREQYMATLTDMGGRTVLHGACVSGSKELCLYLCNTYPSLVTKKDAEKKHCLHYATISGNLVCYKKMESLALNVDSEEKRKQYKATLTDIDERTVLHLACLSGSEEICRYLCKTYPFLMKQTDTENNHCLHYTAKSGKLSCYKAMEYLVLKLIAEEKREQYMTTLINMHKHTVLHEACSAGSQELCVYLSNTYPVLIEQRDAENKLSLHYASESGNLGCYKTMENLVLKVNSEGNRKQYIATLTDIDESNVLHLACSSGSEEICRYLCYTYPFLMKQTDAENNHCLHFAALSGNLNCYKAMESLVLKTIAEDKREQYMATLTNVYKHTVLHKAYLSRNKDLCVYLCKTYPSLMVMMNARF
ncbi:Ankyrin repeat protein [Mizuhopecten yessoensis]|uniref:Ankyrin repeat protein n=1 Tax=Mizuhopecten yessoensis TaxID=6573 RepID=A0A210PDD7_MIZYE|nr:Ankyrin repeat protein [Mizuhopecten yessoensis]